jgi:Ca2+-binding RTX toxin-like protein
LYISIKGTSDKLTILDYFNGSEVENIRFADGAIWDSTAFVASFMISTEGNDVILGSGRNDVLNGGAGMDYLYGNAGNDVLDGGSNDVDFLYGGIGSDTLRLLASAYDEIHQPFDSKN